MFKPLNLIVATVFLTVPPQVSGFSDGFDDGGAFQETATMSESADSHWWLNSGAYVYRSGGIGMTVQGRLADNDRWRLRYAATNPVDTENGYRPQNLLRVITRSTFKDFTQQVYFNIQQINLTESPNRNDSNGVLFFHRYQDGNNLYYAGIRVDGYAVVKKKIQGQYYTLKSVGVYPGVYNRRSKPNLLPITQRIGMRTMIADNPKGDVVIALYLSDEQLGSDWTKVLEAEDAGSRGTRLLNDGYAGIRADFMDVQFDHYEATENDNATKRCTVSISPPSKSHLDRGGDGSLIIAAGNTCIWQAVSNADWITVKSGSSGTGNGVVGYTVAPNKLGNQSRTGTITIAGQTFTVQQARQ